MVLAVLGTEVSTSVSPEGDQLSGVNFSVGE
jgi:hypothetical protein